MTDDSLDTEIAALSEAERNELRTWVDSRRIPPLDKYTLADLTGTRYDTIPQTALPEIALRLNLAHDDKLLREELAHLKARRGESR